MLGSWSAGLKCGSSAATSEEAVMEIACCMWALARNFALRGTHIQISKRWQQFPDFGPGLLAHGSLLWSCLRGYVQFSGVYRLISFPPEAVGN